VHLADVALTAGNHAGWVVKTPQLVRQFSGGITHLDFKPLYHPKNWNKKTPVCTGLKRYFAGPD